MKPILFSLLILAGISFQADAQVFMTRTGKIYFDATTKSSPEKIEGKNNEVACVVDSKSGDIRFQVLVKSFKFERQLMEEHFNENYMESTQFPKADFKTSLLAKNHAATTKAQPAYKGKLLPDGGLGPFTAAAGAPH